MSEPTKFLLGEEQIPTHWINLLPDLPGEPLPPLNPGTGQPAGPDDLTPIFPMGLIMQEVSPEPEVEIPAEVREAYGLWRPTPLFRARRLERALGTSRAHLLQVRGRLAGGLAQAEHRRPAGVRERQGRGQEARDRDRRRAVGLVARVRLLAVRARVRGLHGRLELRPEAVPALDDGDLGRDRAPLAVRPHGVGPRAGRAPDRLARDRDLRGGRGRRPGPGLQLLARLGAQPRAPAPDRDRAGGDPADAAGGRGAGRDRRLRRRRLELRRPGVPVPARGLEGALRGGRAGRVPDAHPRRLPLRLRRHRRADAADADVHARARLRAAARARRRPALPRRRADAVRAREGGQDRGARVQAERDVRGGRAVRPQRGHHPGARAGARDPRGDRGGRARRGRR